MANKWAILIGIDNYHESLGKLKYARADCHKLHETLVSGPLKFPEDQVLLLDDMQDAERYPNYGNINTYIGSWLAAPKKDDLVFVYFAGHGRLVDGKTYLVPGDATLSSLHTMGIRLDHVQDVLEQCKAERKILVLDACHSGAGRDVVTMTGEMEESLASGDGFYTISSCRKEELSHEWDEKGQGVFSYFLSSALRGECSPDPDGRLTLDRIYEWVLERVTKWAAQHRCSQSPQRYVKGTGSLVLMETTPDPVALAEQYRRELEETKARLAEIELKEAREKLDQMKEPVPSIPGKSKSPTDDVREIKHKLKKAEKYAENTKDWCLCAEDWKKLLGNDRRARRCLKKAELLAKDGVDWDICGRRWIILFHDFVESNHCTKMSEHCNEELLRRLRSF